jgi:hypothetical protein
VPAGIRNSTIISCDIGDNCSIQDCAYICHYIIGDTVILSRIDEMQATLARIKTQDHFTAMGLHLSSSPLTIEKTYQRLRAQYGPGSPAQKLSPQTAEAIWSHMERCYEVIGRCEALATGMGVDMRGGQPTPGNIEGGLSSIEEKSLGCIYKAGSRPLQDVIEYAAPITKKGLIWMDTPGQDIEQITGMVAGGCHLVVFTTGRGTCCGSPIAPTIKVATTTSLFHKMNDNIDLDAGPIVTGDETVADVGRRIFAEMLAVASGKLAKAEILGFNDFAINRIGPTM